MKYFINLNVRSNYSFLSSTIKLKDYIAFAKKNDLKTLALTEKNVMYSSYEFYHLCQENNIKPIIGLECQWNHYNKTVDLLLISTNYYGYQLLMQISSIINSDSSFLTDDLITKYLKDTRDVAIIIKVKSITKTEIQDLFLTLNDHGHNLLYFGINHEQTEFIALIQKFTSKIIPLNLVSYLQPEDATIFQVLEAIKAQSTLDPNKLVKHGKQHYQSESYFKKYFPEALLENVTSLVSACNLVLPQLSNREKVKSLPIFKCPNNLDSKSYLQTLCKKGLERRFNSKTIKKNYITRLLYELEIINFMGFNDYFLIVNDYVQFAKAQNILVGPGRGSVAGSLVAFVLGITDVDPLEYDLIFERFLNPERTSLPDIDIDFQDDRREEIFQYLAKKYGKEHVAQIVTFQTIASKMAIRDLGRVFNIALEEINEISKLIPIQYNFDLEQAIKQSPKLSVYAKKYKILFDLAKQIITFPRQTSTHAAGVVLAQKSLIHWVPLQVGFNNIYQTQYAMKELEHLGLIKMDILGLRNLTILQNILEKIKQYYSISIDLSKIPLSDVKAFTIIRNGDTTGIFQLESPGMRQILHEMKTNKLEDIIATSSLFRPGPQEYIKTYIKRKLGLEKVKYLHPDLEAYLSSTYGIIVYQEQILLILQKIGGYNLAQADSIRRAISKKDNKQMAQQASEFIKSGIANGYQSNVVKKIWEDIQQFAGYGFNRSHAVAYSLIGYWLAYLKSNYPLAFMSCLLTSVIGNDQKILQYLNECQKYHIKILPPSINYGQLDFAIDIAKNGLNYALPAIKQMSFTSCLALIKERQEHGLFKDFFEFCARALLVGLNRKNCEFLIAAGALDEINANRTLLLGNLDNALKYANIVQLKDATTSQIKLNLALTKPAIINFENNWNDNSTNEYRALGLCLKYNPELNWKQKLDPNNKTISLSKINHYLNKDIIIFGRITSIKTIKTKNNRLMVFATLQSDNTVVDMTVFDNIYQKYQDQIQLNKVILVQAKVNLYQEKIKLILERIIQNL